MLMHANVNPLTDDNDDDDDVCATNLSHGQPIHVLTELNIA